jgi:hypothetical protein
MSVLSLKPAGEFLELRLSAADLGLKPREIWNPSPTVRHRREPWPFPKTIRIGTLGNEDTGAKFSPPPYAVGISDGEVEVLLSVEADAGWHLWNHVDFIGEGDTVTVSVDLEGASSPAEVARHVRLRLVPRQAGESRHALLARGLAMGYPAAYAAPAQPDPSWWDRPIYCGWGDQVAQAFHLESVGPEARALAYCIQGLYDRWTRRLEGAGVPVGTVIIDAGWSPTGTWITDPIRWPDLKGFIARQHDQGRKVLLWLATWLWDGLPDDWCTYADGVKLTVDPTNRTYLAQIPERMAEMLSATGLNADGFKIDQLGYTPSNRRPRGGPAFGRTRFYDAPKTPIKLRQPGLWGAELLYEYQKTIYRAAKAIKPDCLITSSTVHPYYYDSFDMTRLHDTGIVPENVFKAMGGRADLSRAALPFKPIDTDDWVHTNYALWYQYTSGSRCLGVPCIFYAERFVAGWKAEPLTKVVPLRDLRRLAKAWGG